MIMAMKIMIQTIIITMRLMKEIMKIETMLIIMAMLIRAIISCKKFCFHSYIEGGFTK